MSPSGSRGLSQAGEQLAVNFEKIQWRSPAPRGARCIDAEAFSINQINPGTSSAILHLLLGNQLPPASILEIATVCPYILREPFASRPA